ncbi:indolepyruvate oxidoreductase subunit beta family protein [Sphingosinicellaceae bacterium]|nr:indolepyruvate oxidoreductase subunit beta family protein [Sphingosinicellaceae bacterium]
MARQRRTLAILALGGQGGGVLADWILAVGDANGWRTQGTSVPGVAQRTGSTIYYIEMFPSGGHAPAPAPVLALNPVPGDVDIVIASELMEAGRAILRGFVTADRTTLIGSTHRIYAISEKTAMGNGLAKSDRVVEAAGRRARRFIGFDMDAAAASAGSVISSVMLGALAASGELPFDRASFEAAIKASGIAVPANLRGFAAGWDAALGESAMPLEVVNTLPVPTTAAGTALLARIEKELPARARPLATEGVRRLMDYQDAAYATRYLDRLKGIAAVDDGFDGHALTAEAARYLALWMSYEDTIRVADLKTRASRVERVRTEVHARDGQLLGITEFMHPRLQEVCETMPTALGHFILSRPGLVRRLEPLFSQGRHVRTTRLRWFLVLHFLAGLRRWRPKTLRFGEEQARIEAWLKLVADVASHDPAAARELVECQRLIKGYGDTFARGLRNYDTIVAAYRSGQLGGEPATAIRRLREAALADDKGDALAETSFALQLAS